jgi:hypothetical protein
MSRAPVYQYAPLAGAQLLHRLAAAEPVEEGAQHPAAFALRLPVGGPPPICDAACRYELHNDAVFTNPV